MMENEPKIAAFLPHQSAERYIACPLLAHTGCQPKEHDMEKPINQAAIFPTNAEEEKRFFDLPRHTYTVEHNCSADTKAQDTDGRGMREENRGTKAHDRGKRHELTHVLACSDLARCPSGWTLRYHTARYKYAASSD